MRYMRNQAEREQMPYLRSISRAATPFLEATISKMTRTQSRIGRRVPCIIVPVVAENWRRQGRQFHVRRWLREPLTVFRETPFFGTIRYTSSLRHSGQMTPFGHRRPSRNSQASASVRSLSARPVTVVRIPTFSQVGVTFRPFHDDY